MAVAAAEEVVVVAEEVAELAWAAVAEVEAAVVEVAAVEENTDTGHTSHRTSTLYAYCSIPGNRLFSLMKMCPFAAAATFLCPIRTSTTKKDIRYSNRSLLFIYK